MASTEQPVLVIDGVCNLCTGMWRFVVDRDTDERFRFATLQSEYGQWLQDQVDDGDSVLVVSGDEIHTESDAILQSLSVLGGPYALVAAIGRRFPRRIRDGLYRFIARNRYHWFGRRDACMRPDPALRDRFLE